MKKLFLTGGTSQVTNLAPFFTNYLEIPTRIFELSEFPLEVSTCPNFSFSTGALSVALALEGLKKPSHLANNLKRGVFKEKNLFFTSLWDNWGTIIQKTGTAFMIFFIFTFIKEQMSYQAEEKSYEVLKESAATFAQLKGRKATSQNILKYLKEKERDKKNQMIFENLLEEPSAFTILDKLSSQLPKGIEVNVFDIKKTVISLKGTIDKSKSSSLESVLKKMTVDGKLKKISL